MITRNTYLAITLACVAAGPRTRKYSPGLERLRRRQNNPRETRFGNGSQVKPGRSGLRTGWVSQPRPDRRKGPYVVLSFLLLLFCVLCGVIVKSVLKRTFSIISPPAFRKRQKRRTNMARCSSPENYYYSGRNTELKLCRL